MTRVSINRPITRVGLVVSLVGTGMLRWVDRSPDWSDTVLAVLALVAALGLLASVFLPWLLPESVVDPAAMLAAALFLFDGMESVLSQEQRSASIARTVAFTWGAAIVALAVMLDLMRQRREAT